MHTRSSNEPAEVFLKGTLCIRSRESIQSLAHKISTKLFNGIPFGGEDQYIYDEVPAVYLDIVGLRFVLSGYADKHYVLCCAPGELLPLRNVDTAIDVDISDHLYRSLAELPDVTIEL